MPIMLKTLLQSCLFAVTLASCTSSYQPSISVACEEKDAESSIIKWETFPFMDGSLKVYASTNPNNIPLDNPIATTRISEQKIIITTNDSEQRMYYTMIFDDEYPVTTASRNIWIPGTQNFRDIGGYPTHARKNVTWGKIYRSAQLDSVNQQGIKILKGLGIKTIIDLRGDDEHQEYSPCLKKLNIVNAPLHSNSMKRIFERVHSGELCNDSLRKALKLVNIELIENNCKSLKKIFRTLLDPDSYPVVIECSTGKMRTGLVTALLLSSLGVNYELIVQDYELSNNYFNITRSCKYGYSLPENAQEAITALYTSRGDYLDATYEYVTDKYESIDDYMNAKIGLSSKDIKQLRSILLQKPEP